MMKLKLVRFNRMGDILGVNDQHLYLPNGLEDIDFAEDFFVSSNVLTRVFLKNGKEFIVRQKEFENAVLLAPRKRR